ncbi:DUF368 domain-containing protein, partial [Candidatus Bipolaricaulota bacterium]|nr:DUF368 domain-containing protein [Candidatus Bipolaricaulota bacterium]
MNMRERAYLFLRGFCMGIADVIPGVSGGTMALILGIYTRFVDAIKSVNFRFFTPLFNWVKSGFKPEHLRQTRKSISSWHWGFLLVLGFGIVTAFGVGSKIVPHLMARYPAQMRGFFFGLILSSLFVPFTMMREGLREQMDQARKKLHLMLLPIVLLGFCLGAYFVTRDTGFSAPNSMVEVKVEEGDDGPNTLEEIAYDVPSAHTPIEIYKLDRNADLRAQVSPPEDSEDAAAYAELEVPKGVTLYIPKPPYWY